jgi:hypothetical protein
LDFSNFPRPISHRFFLLLLLSPAAAASAISRHFHQKMLAYSLIPSPPPKHNSNISSSSSSLHQKNLSAINDGNGATEDGVELHRGGISQPIPRS